MSLEAKLLERARIIIMSNILNNHNNTTEYFVHRFLPQLEKTHETFP